MRISKKSLKPMFDRLEELVKSDHSESFRERTEVDYHCDLLLERLLKVEDKKAFANSVADLRWYKKSYKGFKKAKDGSIKVATVEDVISDLMYDNMSITTILSQMKKAQWYLGTDKLPNAFMRGGAYIAGVCDYMEHRGDDVEKMIEAIAHEYKSSPRTEQRLNYFSDSSRGGSMFDIVVYCPLTSGYQFMFGFLNEKANGAVLVGHDSIIEYYNQRFYSML